MDGPCPRPFGEPGAPALREAAGRAAKSGRPYRSGAGLTLGQCPCSSACADPPRRHPSAPAGQGGSLRPPSRSGLRASLVERGIRRADRQSVDPRGRGARPGGRPLRGFILSRLAADEAEILTVAVEAASQGKGVGRALLARTCVRLRTRGRGRCSSRLTRTTRPRWRCIERLGFVKVGERVGYYRRKDGTQVPAVIMRKDALGWQLSPRRPSVPRLRELAVRARAATRRLFSRDRKAPTLASDLPEPLIVRILLCLKTPVGMRVPHRTPARGRSSSRSDAR